MTDSLPAAIAAVWVIVLLVALALTVLAVLLIYRIIEEALEIRRLARETLPGAQGIAANTAVIAALGGLAAPAGRLVRAAQSIEHLAAGIEGRVAATVRALRGA